MFKKFYYKTLYQPARASLTLFLINIFICLVATVHPELMNILALRSADVYTLLLPIELITYSFSHVSWMHFFGNFIFMGPFALYLEHKIGDIKFFKYYFITGIGGGLLFLFDPTGVAPSGLIGSSGACFGIVTAALLAVDEHKSLKYLALMLLVFFFLTELVGGIQGFSPIAHFCHLGGILTALLLHHFIPLRKQNEK